MILVTGAGARVGKKIAEGLLDSGYDVLAHYNTSQDGVLELAEYAKSLGRELISFCSDLLTKGGRKELASEVLNRRAVNGIINSASIYTRTPLLEVSSKDVENSYGIHVLAPLVLTMSLIESKRPSSVVNITDAKAKGVKGDRLIYGLSSQSLSSLTKELAIIGAPHVRVNEVAPGYVLPRDSDSEEKIRVSRKKTLTGKLPSVGDLISAVVFFLETASVTGEKIAVDGGRRFL